MGWKDRKILILLLCCMMSCRKDKPADVVPSSGNISGAYIICEGSFGNGNSSLYVYNVASDSTYGDLFQQANSRPLGDVFQSMVKIGNRYFLAVNNSDRVVVTDGAKEISVISIPKPRYILHVSGSKAYVSTLYSNKVYVINTDNYSVTGTIDLPFNNTEGMCLYNNDVLVCCWDTACNNIYRIDAVTDKVVQTIRIGGYAPQQVLVDKEQMLWVLSGNQPKGKISTLTRLDASANIQRVFTFPASASPLKPVLTNKKDSLYFIEANYSGGTDNNGIYRMGIHDAALPVDPFISAAQYQYFWALGIDPASGNIWVGDPKGFIQKGMVYIYQPDRMLTDTLNVGVGPGQFYFE